MSAPFDLERLLAETFVASIDYHDELGSTNTRALELAADQDRLRPLLVITDRQHAGRGRGHNQWWAGPGALTFSLLVDSETIEVPQKNWPLVSLATGLAVAEAVARFVTADLRVKWPNDVYLNGRKVCGILAEASSHPEGVMVIGIGLNVNNSAQHAPTELRPFIASLVDTCQRPLDRTDVLIALLQRLSERLVTLRDDPNQLADAWQERCYLTGRTVQLDMGTQRVTGVVQGIDPEGALCLFTEGGLHRCFSGIVSKII